MAVYTPLSNADIAEFLSHYNVGTFASAQGIAEGIENTNYLLTTQKPDGSHTRYILTIYEQRVKREEIPFFLQLTQYLSDKGIPCPRPIIATGGEMILPINGKPAALIQFLEGKGSPAITPAHMSEVGAMLARMHLAARDFPQARPNNLSLDGWEQLAAKTAARADEVSHGLASTIATELAYLRAHWPKNLPGGIVHADVFPDNVFFDGAGTLTGVIDFYFSCTDAWVYDLLITMNAWCFDEADHRFVPERAAALFASYQSVRRITQPELDAMAVLARGASLRFLLTRLYDWLNPVPGALVTPKDPAEYLAKLRFHQRVRDPKDYKAGL